MNGGETVSQEDLLNSKQAAAFLDISRGELNRRVREGIGPTYVQGAARRRKYRRADLEVYLKWYREEQERRKEERKAARPRQNPPG